MKISSLIYKLKQMRKYNGDVDVQVGTDEFFDDAKTVQGVEMKSYKDWSGRQDPYYCCIICPRSSTE